MQECELGRERPRAQLRRADLLADPTGQFGRWLGEAEAAELADPTAMALATVAPNGTPSLRIVLLKHYDDEGFCWYTDYRSQKGRELNANPRGSLLFHWCELGRQVRVTGIVEKLSADRSDVYFSSRPPASRLSAAVSRQSSPVTSRRELERRVEELRNQFPNGDLSRPEQWGGYRLRAEEFEFWQGRENRLHDRFRYRRVGDNWKIERLSP